MAKTRTTTKLVRGSKKMYAWQQMQLNNLKGEQWKDIRGYRGMYQVSNFGRIRSLSRKIIPETGTRVRSFTYYTPEKMLKQKVLVKENSSGIAPYTECVISLMKDGKAKAHMVARLVYDAFVKPLNFSRDRLFVTHKNNIGEDNYYRNLKTVTRSEATIKAYSLNRMSSPFKLMSDRERKRIRAMVSVKQWKPVQRISAQGKVIKNYPSITAAAEELGISSSNIISVLKGRKETAKGMYWKYRLK